MAINFLPNDPLAVDQMPMRKQDPRSDRPASRAGFTFFGAVPEKQYDQDTDEFLFWQCREAALAAVENWEDLNGNLTAWARSGKKLELSLDFDDPEFTGPQKLNAFYDGDGLRFFIFKNDDDGTRVCSGLSTDTVTHEAGHALLDTLRPEFMESNFPEVNAFHEAFGDINAVLTALADKPTRAALLNQSADLGQANFVEASSEYLSDAIRRQFGNVSPSKPRRLLNQFQWKLPSALPAGSFNDPPDLLSREAHNFSRVFSGCFYDVLRGVFTAGGGGDANLVAATRTVAKLLIDAVKTAPHTPRFFSAVGRGMLLADQDQNDGANQDAIRAAFEGHSVLLGTSPVAPTAVLDGPSPKVLKNSASIADSTRSDLRDRLRATAGGKLTVAAHALAGARVAAANYQREIGLGGLDKRLKGVVAYAGETVLVGSSGGRAAVFGAMPEPNQSEDEVLAFVESLIANGRVQIGQKPKLAAVARSKISYGITHVIRAKGDKKVLTRVRYFCGG
ncbi:MAG TPA: hypothetical protein VHR66_06650 [Gemmataceae bacterium]|jgi:hypothetical protein|nr:hypothetical protein [Gemmataceae bacterium]